jgi:hypothetical protein
LLYGTLRCFRLVTANGRAHLATRSESFLQILKIITERSHQVHYVGFSALVNDGCIGALKAG